MYATRFSHHVNFHPLPFSTLKIYPPLYQISIDFLSIPYLTIFDYLWLDSFLDEEIL